VSIGRWWQAAGRVQDVDQQGRPNLGGKGISGGAVAFAVTAFEQRDYRHDYSSPSPRSHHSLGLRGFRFPPDVIVLAVRWYLRFGLMLATTGRWTQAEAAPREPLWMSSG
jgi:hypothetical protein